MSKIQVERGQLTLLTKAEKDYERKVSLPNHDDRGNTYSGSAGMIRFNQELVIVMGTDENANWEFFNSGLTEEEQARVKDHGHIIVQGETKTDGRGYYYRDFIDLYPNYVVFAPGWKDLELYQVIWDVFYQRMRKFRRADNELKQQQLYSQAA